MTREPRPVKQLDPNNAANKLQHQNSNPVHLMETQIPETILSRSLFPGNSEPRAVFPDRTLGAVGSLTSHLHPFYLVIIFRVK